MLFYKKNIALFYIFIIFLGILLTIFYIDIPLAYIISNNININVVKIFKLITILGSFKYIIFLNIIIISYLIFKKNRKKQSNYSTKIKIMLYGFLAQSITAIIIQILKFSFGRIRPFYYILTEQNFQFTFFNFKYEYVSFPSGHSAAIWAFITCFLIIFKENKYSKLILILGILVSLSRLILNVHFLSDIFVGALIGILSSNIIIKIMESKLTFDKSLKK